MAVFNNKMQYLVMFGWLVCCRVKASFPLVGPRPAEEVPSLGVFLRDPSLYLRKFRKKTTENSERLGRQARPGIQPGTSRQPVLCAELLSHSFG